VERLAKDQALPKRVSEASSTHTLQNGLPAISHTVIRLLCKPQYVLFSTMLMLEDGTLRQVLRKQGRFREGEGCRKRHPGGAAAARLAEGGAKGKR